MTPPALSKPAATKVSVLSVLFAVLGVGMLIVFGPEGSNALLAIGQRPSPGFTTLSLVAAVAGMIAADSFFLYRLSLIHI